MSGRELDDRIKRLERENRDLRRAMLMLSAGTVAAALVTLIAGGLPAAIGLAVASAVVVARLETHRHPFGDTIRIRKLEIVGADGVVRVALGETVDGAGAVATYDAAGRFIAAMNPAVSSEPRWPREMSEPS